MHVYVHVVFSGFHWRVIAQKKTESTIIHFNLIAYTLFMLAKYRNYAESRFRATHTDDILIGPYAMHAQLHTAKRRKNIELQIDVRQ